MIRTTAKTAALIAAVGLVSLGAFACDGGALKEINKHCEMRKELTKRKGKPKGAET